MRRLSPSVSVLLCVLAWPGAARAQTIETVGERAMGMGGAFVAVADDSSGTWWNPAALAAGPFVDASVGWSRTEFRRDGEPRGRTTPVAVSLSTPPFGVSYYRFRITNIQSSGPTVTPPEGREDGRVGVVQSLRLHDLGVTLLRTIFTGVHVGTTLKFLRGRVEHTTSDLGLTPEALLELGDDASGGRSEGQFDADLGVLAVAGPWRVGGIVRNLRAAEFAGEAGGDGIRLPRQARIGVAFDGAARRGSGAAWTVSADVDVASYATGTGDRRVIAAGAERWLFGKRIGVRGGGRFNQVGHKERSATGGVSAAIRPGMFVEAHAVAGGSDDERGWGVAARFSF
ncbi:MAG TPA: conjugal transfer protein TraF [Vicinamibacterales bacterium]|nr:conjugal transfer protein TraF [Vicinamibacterales bacterium]